MGETQTEQIRRHYDKFRDQIAALGDELREREMPEPTEELFAQFERTGNRLLYEDVYFARRKFLTVFGLLGAWYHRGEDIQKLEEVLEEICREETWALPAHVNRSMEGWQRTVDLFAAETGQTLAQILNLTEGYLSETLVRKVRQEVMDRVLDSYLERPKGEWNWERMRNNWSAVCGGCVGIAALYLLGDDSEKQRAIVERVCGVLPNYLEGMYEDGVCPEGLGYFTYGMAYYTGFARLLAEHSSGSVDLMDSEKVRRVARFQQSCYFPGGKTVSFADGSTEDRYRLGLTCYLADTVEGVEIPDISAAMDFEGDTCYRFLPNWQDGQWVREYLERRQEAREAEGTRESGTNWFTFFPEAQWAVWKQKEIGVAMKGGHNGESHNHNDVGSFLLVADGEVFLTDLGCGEYTKDYFNDSMRYSIFCNRSMGHNVPIVDGAEQATGRAFHAASFVNICPGSVETEFAGAYGEAAEFTLCRRLDWPREAKDIVITDLFRGLALLEENLVTQIEPVVEDSRIMLQGIKGTLIVEITGACGDIHVVKEIFRNHKGKDEDVWRLVWPVASREGQGECVMRCRYQKG